MFAPGYARAIFRSWSGSRREPARARHTRFGDGIGNGITDSGESYVVFGASNVGAAGSIELSSLNGANGFAINGVAAGDSAGDGVGGAGDVNGDGFDDIVIGAPYAFVGDYATGTAYVVFGGASVGSGGNVNLASLDGSNGSSWRV